MIFDIIEARHPCSGKPSVVEDIGLRLQEGLQDLHIQEQLTPAREAISRTFATGSTNFFKAMEGVRERWAQRSQTSLSSTETGTVSGTPVEISRSEADLSKVRSSVDTKTTRSSTFSTTSQSGNGLRPLSLSKNNNAPGQQQTTTPASTVAADTKATIGGWGSSIGSFISQRTARLSARTNSIPTVSTAPPQTDAKRDSASQPIVESPTSITHHVEGPVPRQGNGSAVDSPPPLTNLFSSWSFGKATTASASKPAEPPAPPPLPARKEQPKALNGEDENGNAVFQARNLGEFDPPRSPSVLSNDEVQPGMAL